MPESVAVFFKARREGEAVNEDDYDSALKRAVADVVQRQVEVGIDVVDDGEFSKSSWGTYINQRVSGFKNDPDRDMAINYTGLDSDRLGSGGFHHGWLPAPVGPCARQARKDAVTGGG